MAKKKVIKIKTGALSRGFGLAKLGLESGAKWATLSASKLIKSKEEAQKQSEEFLLGALSRLSEELGQLKGSLMKVGQLLSTYGEHFLPSTANDILKGLQNQSPALDWNSIEPILQIELGKDRLQELEIGEEAVACASLGQVHRGKIKKTGEIVAIKIQYPGVDRAVDSDLKALKSILAMAQIIPKEFNMTPIFSEVKDMLNRELDYQQELVTTQWFHNKLKSNPNYIVPKTYKKFSNRRVMVTSYQDGVNLDGSEVMSLDQTRRNRLGRLFFEYYLNEVFRWARVQTDPHFGNYKVRLKEDGNDQLILLDFGAVRELEPSFTRPYRNMIRGLVVDDHQAFIKSAGELGFILESDPESLKKIFYDFCQLIVEPFREQRDSEFHSEDGEYNWGASNLPSKVLTVGKKLILSFKLRTPPSELVFLDRKLGGVFITLSKLRVKSDWRDLLLMYLNETEEPEIVAPSPNC